MKLLTQKLTSKVADSFANKFGSLYKNQNIPKNKQAQIINTTVSLTSLVVLVASTSAVVLFSGAFLLFPIAKTLLGIFISLALYGSILFLTVTTLILTAIGIKNFLKLKQTDFLKKFNHYKNIGSDLIVSTKNSIKTNFNI